MNKIDQTINAYRLKQVKKILIRINHLQDKYRQMTDERLQNQTSVLKERLHNETLSDILPDAYAVIREASRRVLGMFPKDVQVMGAIVMHEGNIAEMQTGEGKTLTATMPLYLNALNGNKAYLITTNDYLARRDYEEMKPLYEWLGLTASLAFVDIPGYEYMKDEKKALYNADIIYTTNGRLGFDYLIDNLADSIRAKYMPELSFCIIDEIDSIILDAAQTPLVISGAPRVQSNLFGIVKAFIDTLEENKHFHVNRKESLIWLTEEGARRAEKFFNVDELYNPSYKTLVRNINLVLRAEYLFDEYIDYYVNEGEVVLIDRITGRLLTGTKLQSGLHQALEAKEGLELSRDMSVMATITFQNLFKAFKQFSGMTATGKPGEKEFFELYGKVVVQIPTDKPVIRKDLKDKVYVHKADKFKAIIAHVTELHAQKRPVLLITRTAEDAEYFSDCLFQLKIPNNLLIAQNVAKEAMMIAEAGHLSAVTVATSMAGRGTDIRLDKACYDIGGLAVIICEHMENSRIDKQLRGRAGRQGDPGSSQIYISLEDYIVKRWSEDKLLKHHEAGRIHQSMLDDSRLLHRKIHEIVTKAQTISEEFGIVARQLSNEFEKSISIQREIIYKERNQVLQLTPTNDFNINQLAHDVFKKYVGANQLSSRELLNYIYKNVSFQFNHQLPEGVLDNKLKTVEFLMQLFHQQIEGNKKIVDDDTMYYEFLQKAMLKAIDLSWIKQVDNLQQIKANIGNKQNGERNIIFEYHRMALKSFEEMTEHIKEQMVRNLCMSIVTFDKKGNMLVHFP
ncbi:accessory Sec system translocase SecA2 [Macrococcoides caseolyticum]|uniref:accessory Sec system translocase SecA2 n=1 Tax=Macrococcoides caseolyticum TaxID=69966 RepID=UPI001F4451F2|nr:accessory Sec system translocase SecA2 [Macrococcus caseolyticus]MCE4957554.1 accessory Sec system translocase SecA2 [Macrococcus caseolyticus]